MSADDASRASALAMLDGVWDALEQLAEAVDARAFAAPRASPEPEPERERRIVGVWANLALAHALARGVEARRLNLAILAMPRTFSAPLLAEMCSVVADERDEEHDLLRRGCIEAGIHSILLIDARPRSRARSGEALCSELPRTAGVDAILDAARGQERERFVALSAREREVIVLASEGLTRAEIGVVLACGAESVKTYLRRARRKLEDAGHVCRTRADLRALRVEGYV